MGMYNRVNVYHIVFVMFLCSTDLCLVWVFYFHSSLLG